MLRFSIMTGIILSTLNPYQLKAFDNTNDREQHTTAVASSPLYDQERQEVSRAERRPTEMELCIDRLQEQQGITIPPEGRSAYFPDGTWVCTLYPDHYIPNMALLDRHGEWEREQKYQQQYSQFLDNNRPLIEKLDKISGERAYYYDCPSTNYIKRAIKDGQPFADLEIGFFALRHREDNRVLMEVFKGISPEERKKYFDNLLFLFSPKFEELTNRMMGEREHNTLKGLEKEIMQLLYDPSKTDLSVILKPLKIKSLFEAEGDSQPASSSQE